MGHNIKLSEFETGEAVAVQIIKKVRIDNSVEAISEINKEIEAAYPTAALKETQNANRS